MGLLFKNVLFTVLVPGTVAVYVPMRIGAGRSTASGPALLVGGILPVCALLAPCAAGASPPSVVTGRGDATPEEAG